MLNEGDQVPDVTLTGMDGAPLSLSAFRGNKLVLYFYPKDDTSGCTREAQDFTALAVRVREGGHLDPRRLEGRPEKAPEVHREIRAEGRSRLRHGRQRLRSLRHLGRKEPLRPQIYGHRAGDLPDRSGRHRGPGLAQGEGARPCRGGAGGGQGTAMRAAALRGTGRRGRRFWTMLREPSEQSGADLGRPRPRRHYRRAAGPVRHFGDQPGPLPGGAGARGDHATTRARAL